MNLLTAPFSPCRDHPINNLFTTFTPPLCLGVRGFLVNPRRAMSVVVAFCLVEFIDGIEGGMDDAGNDELGDAHATLHTERFVAMVDKVNMDFSAIIGIDGAGRVKDGEAVLARKTAARTHLRLVAGR